MGNRQNAIKALIEKERKKRTAGISLVGIFGVISSCISILTGSIFLYLLPEVKQRIQQNITNVFLETPPNFIEQSYYISIALLVFGAFGIAAYVLLIKMKKIGFYLSIITGIISIILFSYYFGFNLLYLINLVVIAYLIKVKAKFS